MIKGILKRMNHRTIILVIASVVVLIAITFIMYEQSVDNIAQKTEKIGTAVDDIVKSQPLQPADEGALQKQLQEILTNGIESECESLNDSRYQFACHDLFRAQKK